MIAEIVKWVLIGMCAFGVLAAIRKPRKPVTAGMFAYILAWNIFEVVSILIFWRS
jgi:hypothetical protein